MGATRVPIFSGAQATGTTVYYGLPVHSGCVGAYVAWTDATSAATITVEMTSFPSEDAAVTTAGTYQWKDSGLTFSGPTGAAAGSFMINIDNARQRRARIKITTTANSNFVIYDGVDAVI